MDKMTKEQRHRCMAAIKSKDTKPEIIVRKFLFNRGYRFRLNHKRLPGKPDIVLRKYKTVIFINGCFWHGHEGCNLYSTPKSNVSYWQNKITKNKERDERQIKEITNMGWNCITIWECELKPSAREVTLNKLDYTLTSLFIKNTTRKYGYINPEQSSVIAAENNVPYTKRKEEQ